MSDDRDVRPALSAEAWAAARRGDFPVTVDNDENTMLLAAAALHLDRAGHFTWDDVGRLRRNAFNAPDGYSGNPWMEELADRIAALLPPREP